MDSSFTRSTATTKLQCFLQGQPICQVNKLNAYLLGLLPKGKGCGEYSMSFLLSRRKAIRPHLNNQGTRIPRGLAYAFLDNRSCVTLIVVFFGACGPCPHLLSTTHMKNGHTGCHTHTWKKKKRCTDSKDGMVPRIHQNRNTTHSQTVPWFDY